MARGKNETQQVVAHVVVDGGRQRSLGTHLSLLELAAEMLVLAVLHLAASQVIDRAMLRRRHEPRARIVRHARLGPLLEGRDERVLRQVFRDPDVADDAR